MLNNLQRFLHLYKSNLKPDYKKIFSLCYRLLSYAKIFKRFYKLRIYLGIHIFVFQYRYILFLDSIKLQITQNIM